MKTPLPSLRATFEDLALSRGLRQAAAGDAKAFKKAYRKLHPLVFGYVGRRLSNRADVEDLTAKVFERVVRNLSGFDPTRGSARAWVLTMARNAVIDELRRAGSRTGATVTTSTAELADASLLPCKALEQDEAARLVRELLADVPAATREMFTLRYADGLRHGEIAALLGLSEAAVKQRMSRLVRSLRERGQEIEARGDVRYAL